jgi:hypothetical protein
MTLPPAATLLLVCIASMAIANNYAPAAARPPGPVTNRLITAQSRASAARSLQVGLGVRSARRLSTVISWRSASTSMSLDAEDLAGSAIQDGGTTNNR